MRGAPRPDSCTVAVCCTVPESTNSDRRRGVCASASIRTRPPRATGVRGTCAGHRYTATSWCSGVKRAVPHFKNDSYQREGAGPRFRPPTAHRAWPRPLLMLPRAHSPHRRRACLVTRRLTSRCKRAISSWTQGFEQGPARGTRTAAPTTQVPSSTGSVSPRATLRVRLRWRRPSHGTLQGVKLRSGKELVALETTDDDSGGYPDITGDLLNSRTRQVT